MAALVDHPKEKLLFFVLNPDSGATAKLVAFVSELSQARQWTIGPPEFIDVTEDASSNPIDFPLRTLGGVLELYSARLPREKALPRELDKAQYDETEFLLDSISKFSREEGYDFGLELRGELIGEIHNGRLDRSITLGFLDEWKKMVR